MKRSIAPQRPKTNRWPVSPRRGIRVARQRKINICFDKSNYLSRPVKIRVVATPTTSLAPRIPQAFPAGSPLNETLEVLIVLELPVRSSLRASDVREPIDWRICGEQDQEPGMQSDE